MTITKLIELFPQYEKEMRKLSDSMACGCSLCVWGAMKSHYPELSDSLLPDDDRYSLWR